MMILGFTGIIFIIIGVLMLRDSVQIKFLDLKICQAIKFAQFSSFLIEKMIFTWFCFRSRYRAEQEAADLVVFDIHIRKIWLLMPLSLLLLVLYFVETRNCLMTTNLYMSPALILGLQSFFELTITKTYLKWHQNHLKVYEGCM